MFPTAKMPHDPQVLSTPQADNGNLIITADDATGTGITGTDTTLSGDAMALTSAGDIAFDATDIGGSSFITDVGDMVLSAAGSFSDTNGAWETAGSMSFSALGDFTLQTTTLESGASLIIDTAGALDAQNTQARATDHLLVSADEAAFSGESRRTEFVATNGGLIVTTLGVNSAGDLVNTGALLQGGQFVDGLEDADGTQAEGAVTLNVKGTVTNMTAPNTLGGAAFQIAV